MIHSKTAGHSVFITREAAAVREMHAFVLALVDIRDSSSVEGSTGKRWTE
jgi:hypothetical protein